MKKRFLSLLLALTVCLALAVPAFADVSGSWDSIWWVADSTQSGEDVLELDGSGTLSGVKNHMDPYLEDWDLMDYYVGGQFSWFDVGGSISRIADGAFEGYTKVKGIRIGSSVTEIGDMFGSTLGSLTNKPVIIYGVPGSAAEDFVNRTNAKNPGTLLFVDSTAYQLGEDPNAAPRESCGGNTTWSFDRDTYTLTIRGTGPTTDYGYSPEWPWMKYENALPEHAAVEEGVTRLGNRIFAGVSDLKSVSLPNTLTEIGEGAFMDSGLPEITLPANLAAIGKWAFSGCNQLTGIAIPGGITRLESGTFERCSGLASVSIPASVTYIDDLAFWACDSLTDVYYEGTAEQWAQIQIEVNKGMYENTATPNGKLSAVNIHYGSYTPVMPTNPAAPTTPGQPEPGGLVTDFYIVPTASTVLVNGANVAFDAYNINGANYFKLRDLAMALNGSAKQFEVSWDAAANAISLTSNAAYTAVGGELAVGNGNVETFRPTDSKIILDGAEISLEAFNINGNNYFKLRDIGSAFDFGVDWDGAANTVVIDTNKGYTPD